MTTQIDNVNEPLEFLRQIQFNTGESDMYVIHFIECDKSWCAVLTLSCSYQIC